MKLNELKPAEGSVHRRKRVGRGESSGWGKTSGRGHKGQNARSGGGVRPGFEGGQMPLIRRVPKRGFTNIFRKDYTVVNLDRLEQFDNGAQVSPEVLYEKGIISSLKKPVKILGQGEISKKLTIKAHAFSKSAQEKIEKAGGQLEGLK